MSKQTSPGPSRIRNIYFRILSILLVFLLLGLVEIGLRIFSYGGSMKLFVDHKVENYENYYIVNPFVGLKYFDQYKATEATNDIFLKKKPDQCFRVFVMGSSTVYGFPYDFNLMASRILHKRLQDAYPDQHIEIINTSITAINSVTLKDFSKQIVRYQPDAVIIYAGHNEFYGAFGVGSKETTSNNAVIRSIHFGLMNLRLYQLLKSGMHKIMGKNAGSSNSKEDQGTLMKRIVNDLDIVYQGDIYEQGIEQFENNLDDILHRFKSKGIPVFLGDLVSNVRNLPPFGNNGTGEKSATENYIAAQNALTSGDTALAKKLFYDAKDLDPVRFRASDEINDIIYERAKEEGCTLIPVKAAFSEASPYGIIGNNLITEHVHPNIDGQFLLADLFYKTIINSELVGPAPDQYTSKSAAYYRTRWGYTALDSLIGEYRVQQLKSYWPFRSFENEVRFRDVYQPEGVIENIAFRVISDPDASVEELHDMLGDYYEKNGNAVLALKEYTALAQINPYWSDYLNKAANAYFNLNDLHAAETYVRRSLKYTETYFANSMLGEIEFIKHAYSEALSYFENAYEMLDTEPVNPAGKAFLLSRLYYLYHLNGNIARNQDIVNQLMSMGYNQEISLDAKPYEYSNYIPYDIEVPFKKAVSFSESNLDSAFYYLNSCLEINDCPVVNLYIGDILYEIQDLEALHYYRKASEAYDYDPSFQIRLFYANFVNMNKSRAEKALNKLKEIDPMNNQIQHLETILAALREYDSDKN